MEYSITDLQKIFPTFKPHLLQNPMILEVMECISSWRFVGGCVRDALLGKHVYDIDINTPMLPQDVHKILKDNGYNVKDIGIAHGTITVFIKGYSIEITTLRRDIDTDGRHATVAFSTNWEDDSNRRDFTINGLMFDPKGILYDYHKGINDLQGIDVNFIGDVATRIREDYLRIIRYIRFICRFNSAINPNVFEILYQHIHHLKNIAKERIWMELVKMMEYDNWQYGISVAKKLGIDKDILQCNFKYDSEIIPTTISERWAILLSQYSDVRKIPIPTSIKRNILPWVKDLSTTFITSNNSEQFHFRLINGITLNYISLEDINTIYKHEENIFRKFEDYKLQNKHILLTKSGKEYGNTIKNLKENFITKLK